MSQTHLVIIEKSKKWLVIDKPAGISVHNDEGDVRHLLKKQLPAGSYTDIYLVHRLDKETSGALVVATEQKAAAELATQFQNRVANKKYLAVLRGTMEVTNQWQDWKTPISDKSEGRKNPQGLAKDRVDAHTQYRVLESNKYFSLVEFNLLTGRQHQIRKHAAIARHAILGDDRYSDPKYNKKMANLYNTDRMFLHAFEITLTVDGADKTFSAPTPEEFKKILSTQL